MIFDILQVLPRVWGTVRSDFQQFAAAPSGGWEAAVTIDLLVQPVSENISGTQSLTIDFIPEFFENQTDHVPNPYTNK